jgi:hypothetical protein
MEFKIKDILADIADVNDPEVYEILGIDGMEDPRRKALRLAQSGKVPAYQPWRSGQVIFFKSELRRHMAERYETV